MEKKIYLIFTLTMSIFMIFFMSLVVTIVNIGVSDIGLLLSSWAKGFVVAWIAGFPLMFVFAPIFKKIITKNISKSI